MRSLSLLAAGASAFAFFAPLCAQAKAQAPRLADCVEAPLAYLCLEPLAAGADASAPAQGAVQRLLADPSLDALFGDRPAAGTDSKAGRTTTRALALVRGVLARSGGGLELALTGVVPGAGQPLLVLRARLQPAEADRLKILFDGPSLAVPHRTLGSSQTYRLQGAGSGDEAPGELVELALVGNDLVAGNDGLAMQELLEAKGGTVAGRKVLSADPHFTSLRQRTELPPGSLLVYGDWQRLGRRMSASLPGMSGLLLGSSGLGNARSIMISVAAAQADLAATVLLDFDGDGPAAGGSEVGGIDGWVAAAQSVPARSLLPELPDGGLGGLIVAVDLPAIAARSRSGARMLRDVGEAFHRYGLDFDRNVLGRLGSRGTVQFLVGRGSDGAAAEVRTVYSLRAKTRKAATDLFEDLRRACESSGLGKLVAGQLVPGQKERRPDVLEVSPHRDLEPTRVAVFEDLVLVAADADTLGQVHEELRASKRRGKRDQHVATTIHSIGGSDVVGIFDLDLEPLFAQVVSAFAGSGARVDLTQVPKRHIGYLDLQPRTGGTTLRIRVLSSR